MSYSSSGGKDAQKRNARTKQRHFKSDKEREAYEKQLAKDEEASKQRAAARLKECGRDKDTGKPKKSKKETTEES